MHSDVCKLCLASRCLAPALDLLSVDLTDIARDTAQDVEHILLFFYYGGMIYAAVKVKKKRKKETKSAAFGTVSRGR